MITKCEFRYMKFAKSTSHGACVEQRLLEAGLEERPERALEVDHVVGVGERRRAARVGDPADHLVAVVGEEEEQELQPGIQDPLRQQAVDRDPTSARIARGL